MWDYNTSIALGISAVIASVGYITKSFYEGYREREKAFRDAKAEFLKEYWVRLIDSEIAIDNFDSQIQKGKNINTIPFNNFYAFSLRGELYINTNEYNIIHSFTMIVNKLGIGYADNYNKNNGQFIAGETTEQIAIYNITNFIPNYKKEKNYELKRSEVLKMYTEIFKST